MAKPKKSNHMVIIDTAFNAGLETAARCIETTLHAVPHPNLDEVTRKRMKELRDLCVKMWAADIRALKMKKEVPCQKHCRKEKNTVSFIKSGSRGSSSAIARGQ